MTPQKQQFLKAWRGKYVGRSFDFSKSEDQEEFFEGMTEMVKHIIHSSAKASIYDVATLDGIETLYINAQPNKPL